MGARSPLWFGVLLALTPPLAFVLALPLRATAPAVPTEPTPADATAWLLGAAAMVILATASASWLLWLVRTGRVRWIRGIFLAAVAILLTTTLAWPVAWASQVLSDDLAWLAAFLVSGSGVAVWARWGGRRSSNVLAVAVAAGTAAALGTVLTPLPLLVLLLAFLAYDVWAVRRTGHMQHLAVAVQRLDLPLTVDTGVLARRGPRTALPARADAMLVGMGDLLLPSAWFVSVSSAWGAGPALGAWLGTLAGAWALRSALRRDPVQPGLPLLVGGGATGGLAGLLVVRLLASTA